MLLAKLGLYVVLSAQLDDLVLKNGVADFMTRHLTEPINRGNLLVLDVKLDFDVASIMVDTLSSRLWSSNNLQSVAHVGRDQQIVRIDLKKWEYLNSEHLRDD